MRGLFAAALSMLAAACAAAAALSLSGCYTPTSSGSVYSAGEARNEQTVRVGVVEGRMVINPTYEEQRQSLLNIMVVGTADGAASSNDVRPQSGCRARITSMSRRGVP